MNRKHLLAIALLWITPGIAGATIYCVRNGSQLNSALVSAASNGQDDEIRLPVGTYLLSSAGTLQYLPGPSESFDLEISGGWTSSGSSTCAQLPDSTRAIDTVITTSSARQLMSMSLNGGNFNVTIRRVTFLGGDAGDAGTGGLAISSASSFTGTVIIDQCAFIANAGGYASALGIGTRTGSIRVRNSLFLENDTATNTTVGLADLEGGSGGIYFTNNTVLGNTTSNSGATAGVYIFTEALAQAFIANNNLWDNDNRDLSIGGDGYTYLRNNNLHFLGGSVDESTGNISVEPVYQTGNLNYTPVDGSPLIDSGIEPNTSNPIPIPFDQAWSTGEADVFTRDRRQGAKIDIGAYESSFDTSEDILFADGFE